MSNFIEKITAAPLKKIAESNLMQKHMQKANIGSYATGVAVASIVSKDALGMYYYVKQSLNNEKIPEDKRKFVAALDLANGALMITSQILLTLLFAKVQKPLFNKVFGKFLNKNSVEKLVQKIPKEAIKHKPQDVINARVETFRKEVIDKTFSGFQVLTSLIVATILAKRVVVPFLSTPLATWAKEKFFEKDKKQVGQDAFQSSTSIKK